MQIQIRKLKTKNYPTESLTKLQPAWVLASGSADHDDSEVSRIKVNLQNDNRLIKARYLNRYDPNKLKQKVVKQKPIGKTQKVAILLIGQLRCLNKSGELLKQLAEHGDLFIVTSKEYANAAQSLNAKEILVVQNDNIIHKDDTLLPYRSMKQWHKLHLALKMMRNEEKKSGTTYTYALKIRSDYYFAHPSKILSQFITTCQDPLIDITGASDKVFGGSRDLMNLMSGFYYSLLGWFNDQEDKYWPINLDQILTSDDSIKWYGMNWPIELIGCPKTTEEWRKYLTKNQAKLRIQLQTYKNLEKNSYHKLFQGNQNFASEVAFARFLNLSGLSYQECKGLRGFLYSQRNS